MNLSIYLLAIKKIKAIKKNEEIKINLSAIMPASGAIILSAKAEKAINAQKNNNNFKGSLDLYIIKKIPNEKIQNDIIAI